MEIIDEEIDEREEINIMETLEEMKDKYCTLLDSFQQCQYNEDIIDILINITIIVEELYTTMAFITNMYKSKVTIELAKEFMEAVETGEMKAKQKELMKRSKIIYS